MDKLSHKKVASKILQPSKQIYVKNGKKEYTNN